MLTRLRHDLALRALLSNSLWLLLDKGMRLVLGVTVGAWVARYLGPVQFGELAFALAIVALFQAAAGLGLDGILVRELSQRSAPDGTVLGTALSLRWLAGALGWLVAVLYAGLADGWWQTQMQLVALTAAVLVFQPAEALELWFQSQGQAKRGVQARLLAYAASHATKVALILFEAPLIAFAASALFDALATAVALSMAYRRWPSENRWSVSGLLAARLLKESWPLMIGAISVMVYMRIDQVMVKEALGVETLGVYAAVLPLATLWAVIPMTINASLAPTVARAKAQSEQAYQRLMGQIFRSYAALGWVLAILSAASAYVLVPVLFGPAFEGGIAPVMVYGLCNAFIAMGAAQTLWVLNERKPMVTLYKAALGAIACVLLNAWLLPSGGLMGAALAAVIAQFVSTVASNSVLAPEIFKRQIRGLLLLPAHP